MQRNKEWIVPLASFIIVVAIVIIGQQNTNKIAKLEENIGETPAVEWPSQQIKKETIKESNKNFEITAYYPVTQDEAITAYMRDFVQDQVDSFKQSVMPTEELPEGYPAATFDISYEERKSSRADNYLFTIYSDTGGAHGLTASQTFSFTKSGERIAIEDLFTNGTKGLGVIADYVKTELMKRDFADQKWISEGTAPTADNYLSFIIEDSGITFIFDPYQVAAYASGTQTVSVPTAVFAKIANPELFGTTR